ncbi:putative MFS family arabinose efflux permease [Sphingomonas zeicaulis]|uniref:MFS transporter n=1 Tax=Sphingomonas zeicaulis TaxID=1632740 RepID=UPI003D2329F6
MLFALFLVSSCAQIDRILPFILAESIKAELSLSDTEIGLITGVAFAICYTSLSLPLARASDSGSPRFVLVGCMLVWSAMTALGGLATGFLFLALTRFGVAVGEAGTVPAGNALIARKIAPERRGLAIGIFSMGIPLGTMAGFAIGGAVNDALGWRVALVGAGAAGGLVALFAWLAAGPTPPVRRAAVSAGSFLRSSLDLLMAPQFRWLFVAAVTAGFAAAPFYAFAPPFLIRTYGYTAAEAGLAFGLLQGVLGIAGTLLGGRGFDRAVRAGRGGLLRPPAIVFLVAAATTTAALFASTGWMAVALMVPGMFSFAYMLPWAFGTAHRVAGEGREGMASSLGMIGSSLLGPAFGPLFVGLVSDAATGAGIANGLALGLLIVPVASVLTGIVYLVADRRLAVTPAQG